MTPLRSTRPCWVAAWALTWAPAPVAPRRPPSPRHITLGSTLRAGLRAARSPTLRPDLKAALGVALWDTLWATLWIIPRAALGAGRWLINVPTSYRRWRSLLASGAARLSTHLRTSQRSFEARLEARRLALRDRGDFFEFCLGTIRSELEDHVEECLCRWEGPYGPEQDFLTAWWRGPNWGEWKGPLASLLEEPGKAIWRLTPTNDRFHPTDPGVDLWLDRLDAARLAAGLPIYWSILSYFNLHWYRWWAVVASVEILLGLIRVMQGVEPLPWAPVYLGEGVVLALVWPGAPVPPRVRVWPRLFAYPYRLPGGVGGPVAPAPWRVVAPRGPWALAPASPWRPHLGVEGRLAAGGGGEEAPVTWVRPGRLHVPPQRFWDLTPIIEEPEGRREWAEARTWVLGVLTKANWGWGARLYRLAPPAGVLRLGPAPGTFLAPSTEWPQPPLEHLRPWARGIRDPGPLSEVPFVRSFPAAFRRLVLPPVQRSHLWAWVARIGAAVPGRELNRWGGGEVALAFRPAVGAWGARAPLGPTLYHLRRRPAPGCAHLRDHWRSLFASRWPHLVLTPITTLLGWGRPGGGWLFLAWCTARGHRRRAWASERWLLIFPLGWLDPETATPTYCHGGDLGDSLDVPDRLPLLDRAWSSSELENALTLRVPRRKPWLIPGPAIRRAHRYLRRRARRLGRAILLFAVLVRTYWSLGNPTLNLLLNPWLDEDWLLQMPFPPEGGGGAEAALARATTSSFPPYSKRWPFTHGALLWAWVATDMDNTWGRGVGRSGRINGHRRALPPSPERFVAGRHRSWTVDEAWAVDRRRETLALSDPSWLSTLKFWGWEPHPTLPRGHNYAVFWAHSRIAHTYDLLRRAGPVSTPRGTLLPADGLRGRRYFGALWAPGRPWFSRRWHRFQIRLLPFPTEFLIPRIRRHLNWYPQWTHKFLWRHQDAQRLYSPHWQIPSLRFQDTWGKENRNVPLEKTLATRSANFWSGLIYTPPTSLGWRAVTGNLEALGEYWRCHLGEVVRSTKAGAGFRLRWVWGWGPWRVARYSALHRPHAAWAYDLGAPRRPTIRQGGFLRTDWTPLRFRHLWALAHLTFGPEHGAVFALRALGGALGGCGGAALFGAGEAHVLGPSLSPLLSDPLSTVAFRGVRALAWGLRGGRPPHLAWTFAPSEGATWGSYPRPRGLHPQLANPSTTTPLQDEGGGVWDWYAEPYEGAYYGLRRHHFYRTYSRSREAMTTAAQARLVPSWEPEWSPRPSQGGLRLYPEAGYFWHSPEVVPAFKGDLWQPPLYTYPTQRVEGPHPVYPDPLFRHQATRPSYQGVVPMPHLSPMQTNYAAVPLFRYRYPRRHRWERASTLFGAPGRADATAYITCVDEIPARPSWELAPWKFRPVFEERAPGSRGQTSVGAEQMDNQDGVGGLPYYEDGVPIRLPPGPRGRFTLGALEDRMLWRRLRVYPTPRRGWQGSVDPAFQHRLDLLAKDKDDKLLIHRGLGFDPNVPSKDGSHHKIWVKEHVSPNIEGSARERSGYMAFTRPARPPHPPTALWSRRGRTLRGAGPWRFEWPDYASPARLLRYRLTRTQTVKWGPHVDPSERPNRARARPTPGPDAYAEVLAPLRPMKGWCGRQVRRMRAGPNRRVVPVHTHRPNSSPQDPTVLLRNYEGRILAPRKDWALSPTPPQYMGATEADFWDYALGAQEDFRLWMGPTVTARRFRLSRRDGSREYQQDQRVLGDIFFPPRRVRLTRPRSKALVDPLGEGPAPWLWAKEDMHVRGDLRLAGGDRPPMGCDIPPFGTGRWRWVNLTAVDWHRRDFVFWVRQLPGRIVAPLRPLWDILGETKDVRIRLARAMRGLWDAVPTPPVPAPVLRGLGAAWAALPTPPTPREVGAELWDALPSRPRCVRDVPSMAGADEANPLEFFITDPLNLWLELPVSAVLVLAGALWAGWVKLRPLLPNMPELSPLLPSADDLSQYLRSLRLPAREAASACWDWAWAPGVIPPIFKPRPLPAPSPWPTTVGGGGLPFWVVGPTLLRTPYFALDPHVPNVPLIEAQVVRVWNRVRPVPWMLYLSPMACIPPASGGLAGPEGSRLPHIPWPNSEALDVRPVSGGSARPWGGDWRRVGGYLYEAARWLSDQRWDHLRYGFPDWHLSRWRVGKPVGIYRAGSLDWNPDYDPLHFSFVPLFIQRWYTPCANFDRHVFQSIRMSYYSHPFKDPFTRVGRLGVGDYTIRPLGMGAKNRRHSSAFPDLEWARGKDPVFRQVGNRSLALWRGDALPAVPTWEYQPEMATELLHDEPKFEVLGRFNPIYTDSYVQCLSVSHLLWWDHWRVFGNVRKGLARLACFDGSLSTLRKGTALGWGGARPHNHWDVAPGVAPVRGARYGSVVGLYGPHSPGPWQGRPEIFDYGKDPHPTRDRGLPQRLGGRRHYGGRRYGPRLSQAQQSRHAAALDPAALPWGVQALIRGFEHRSMGDPLAPRVSWLGGLWAQVLGRDEWPSAHGWGGVLALGPHFRTRFLGGWIPGLWVPHFRHNRYTETRLYNSTPMRWGGYSVSHKRGEAGPWVYTPRPQLRPSAWGRKCPVEWAEYAWVFFQPQIRKKPNPWSWNPVRLYLVALYPFACYPRLPRPPLAVPNPDPKELVDRSYARLDGVSYGSYSLGNYHRPYRPVPYPAQVTDPLFLAAYGFTPQKTPLWDFVSDSRWHSPALTSVAGGLGIQRVESALPWGYGGEYAHDQWVRWFRSYPFFRTYMEAGLRSGSNW